MKSAEPLYRYLLATRGRNCSVPFQT
eukprot:COSAG01_NODE_22596_length_849_cov_1.490667_1_plen_25_part_10